MLFAHPRLYKSKRGVHSFYLQQVGLCCHEVRKKLCAIFDQVSLNFVWYFHLEHLVKHSDVFIPKVLPQIAEDHLLLSNPFLKLVDNFVYSFKLIDYCLVLCQQSRYFFVEHLDLSLKAVPKVVTEFLLEGAIDLAYLTLVGSMHVFDLLDKLLFLEFQSLEIAVEAAAKGCLLDVFPLQLFVVQML